MTPPWPEDRWNRTSSHGGVIDERSGVRAPYRANAQCRDGLQPLNMKRQEITILLQIRTHLRFGFLRSTAPRGAGMCSLGTVTVSYIPCLLCQHKGRGYYSFLRVRGKGGSLLTLRTYPKLTRSNSNQKGIDARCRDSNLGSLTKS